MKTPRELLLENHCGAEYKLNAIRRSVIGTLKEEAAESAPMSWSDFLRSRRWHFASIGALWLVILFLHLDMRHAPAMMASVPPAKPASPQVILASLRENRRQLYQMIEPPLLDAESRNRSLPKPRSDRRVEIVLV